MAKFRFRITLILVIVFLGLLAFVYFYESKRPTKKENETEIEKIEIWEFNKEDVNELNITNKNGEFLIVREDEKWQAKKLLPGLAEG